MKTPQIIVTLFLATFMVFPETISKLHEYGSRAFNQGEYLVSTKFYQEILNKDPEDIIAIFNMGLCQINLENYELALENLKKAKSLLKDEIPSDKIDSYLAYAYGQLEKKDSSLFYINHAISKNNLSVYYIFKSNLLYQTSDYENALMNLDTAEYIGLDEKQLESGYLLKANIYYNLNIDSSVYYLEYLVQNYYSVEILKKLVNVLMLSSNIERAIFYIQEFPEKGRNLSKADYLEFLKDKSLCFLFKGNYSEADSILTSVLEDIPNDNNARELRMSASLGSKKYKQYLDDLELLKTSISIQEYLKKKIVALKCTDITGALLTSLELERVSPTFDTYKTIGELYYDLKKFDKSSIYYEKCYKLNSDDPELVSDYAMSLINLKQYNLAEKVLTQSINNDIINANVFFNLAIALDKSKGDTKKLCDCLDKALSNGIDRKSIDELKNKHCNPKTAKIINKI